MTLPNAQAIRADDASGVALATHQVAGKDYQVVLLAGPSGHLRDTLPTWYVFTGGQALAANKVHLSIFNGAGSGVVLKVRKLFLLNLQTAAVTGVMVLWRVLRSSSAGTGGTTVTPRPADSQNPALPAQVVVTSNPTTPTEVFTWFEHAVANDEIGATSAFPTPQILAGLNLLAEGEVLQEITLREGEGLLVKQITSTTVGSYAVLAVVTCE